MVRFGTRGYARPRIVELSTPAGPVELDMRHPKRLVATAGRGTAPPFRVEGEDVALSIPFGYLPDRRTFSLLAEVATVAWRVRDEGPPPRGWIEAAVSVVRAVEAFLESDATARTLAEAEVLSETLSTVDDGGEVRQRLTQALASCRRALMAPVPA